MTRIYQDVAMTGCGVLFLESEGGSPLFVGAFGEMRVPDDVWARAARIAMRFGRDKWEYAAGWCDRQLKQIYKARA
jgi:hypothetical protein